MLSYDYHYQKGNHMKNNFKEIGYQELLNRFKNIIKAKELKYTLQREVILQTLYESSQHLTPDDLHTLVKQKHPNLNIGTATVYRTLSLLEESGLASSISLGLEGKKYEIVNKPHHDHLICNKCGKIVEFENEQIEKLQEQIAQENGFKLTNHLMQLYGICKECQSNT